MSVEQRRRSRIALWEEVMNVQDYYSNKMMDETTSRGKNGIPERKRRIQMEYYGGTTLSKVQGHKGKITWRYFSVVLLVCLTVSLLILPLVLPPLPPPPFLLLLLPILIFALLMLLAFMPANSRHVAYAYM